MRCIIAPSSWFSQRMLGIVPHLTREQQARRAAMQAAKQLANPRTGAGVTSCCVQPGRRFHHFDQPVRIERLGHVAVHSRGQAPLAVAFHAVRRQGDDRGAPSAVAAPIRGSAPWPPARPCRASGRPSGPRRRSASWMRCERSASGGRHRDLVAALFEQLAGQPLIHRVVFGQQNAQIGHGCSGLKAMTAVASFRACSSTSPGVPVATPKRALKCNVLPLTEALSTQISPSIMPHQPGADRQSQPGAAIGTSVRSVSDSEGLENHPLLIRSNAHSCIGHRDANAALRWRPGPASSPRTVSSGRTVNSTPRPCRCELDGVAQQVHQNLPTGGFGHPPGCPAPPRRPQTSEGPRLRWLAPPVRSMARTTWCKVAPAAKTPPAAAPCAGLDLGEVEHLVEQSRASSPRNPRRFQGCSRCSACGPLPAPAPSCPRTPFIGVRTSWLMLARNSLL